MSTLFEKMTAIADNIRSLLGLTEKLGLDAMTENLDTANTEVESQTEIIEQLRAVISEKAGKPLGGSIDALIDGSITEVMSNATKVAQYGLYRRSELVKASFPLATTVGESAFQTCDKMVEVDLPLVTTVGMSAFNSCIKLTKLNIPLLASVEKTAFNSLYSLEVVDFKSLKKIGQQGFKNGYKLKTFILRSDTICALTYTNAFDSCFHILGTTESTYNPNGLKDGYFYVPRALLSDDDATKDYRRATNWTTFASQFRAIEDFSVDGTITGELDESKI